MVAFFGGRRVYDVHSNWWNWSSRGLLGQLWDNLGLFKLAEAEMGVIMGQWGVVGGSVGFSRVSVGITEGHSNSVGLSRVHLQGKF